MAAQDSAHRAAELAAPCLHIERKLLHAEVQSLLITIYEVDAQHITVFDVDAWLEYEPEDNIKLICTVNEVGGEFPTFIEIYVRDQGLATLDNAELAQRVCTELGCRVLIDDYSVNPYTFRLVSASGQHEIVSIHATDSGVTLTAPTQPPDLP